MEPTAPSTETVFIVKEDQEHCFLFRREDPIDLYHALLRSAEEDRSTLSREEATEVLEGIIPERIRSI
ncbi:MAG: hypothetical protein AAF517_08040 [Planctomycetota bacterium]